LWLIGVDTSDGAKSAGGGAQLVVRVCFQWLRSDAVDERPQHGCSQPCQHHSAL